MRPDKTYSKVNKQTNPETGLVGMSDPLCQVLRRTDLLPFIPQFGTADTPLVFQTGVLTLGLSSGQL